MTNIKGNIYKVILTSASNQSNIILYYINYDMSIVNLNGVFRTLHQPAASPAAPHPGQALLGAAESLVNVINNYAPLLLLTNDDESEINSYGLYSNYVVSRKLYMQNIRIYKTMYECF